MRLNLARARVLLAEWAGRGLCEDDPRVVTKINEARERLMTKETRWKGMVQRFVFNISNSCLTLPREILTVEGAEICRTRYPIKNQWYEVQEGGPGRTDLTCYNILHDRGDGFATFVDICAGSSRQIRVYCDVAETGGARILLQGFDENGNRVRTMDGSNGYVDGEYVALNNATPQLSNTTFSAVDGVQKETTNGFIRLYAYDSETATQNIISILHPDDTAPSYRRYYIPGVNDSKQIMIMAVLRYLPVSRDTDFLIIENLGALKHQLLALQKEESGDLLAAAQHEGKAEQILKRELDGYVGDAARGSMPVQFPGVGAGDICSIL